MHSLVIGCDNAGVELKTALINMLQGEGIEVEDIGCESSADQTTYPLIAERLCSCIIEGAYQKRGVLVCGTGIGMCMAANKCKGIRAAVCHDNFSAERSILSNDGNVICFGARVVGQELAKKILREWIRLDFADGPSTSKVQAIMAIETANFK